MAFLGLQLKAMLIGLLTIISLAYTIDNELHRSFQFGLRRSLIVNNDSNQTSASKTSGTLVATTNGAPPQRAANKHQVEEQEEEEEEVASFDRPRIQVAPPGITGRQKSVLLNEHWNDDNYTNEAGCDLGGRVVRVAVAPQPPLVDCLQDQYGDWTCSGSNIEVIKLLEERLNFRAEWVVLTSMGGGGAESGSERGAKREASVPVESANFSGVIGIVASGKAWLSANGLLRTVSRESHLLLSEPFDYFRFHFLLSRSVRDHDHLFLKPFSAKTWCALLVSALAIFPLMYLLNKSSAHYAMRDDPLLRQVSGWRCARYVLFRLASAPCRLVLALCSSVLWCLCCCGCFCWRRRLHEEDSAGSEPTSGFRQEPLDKQVHSFLNNNNNNNTTSKQQPNKPLALARSQAKLSRRERRLRKRLLERQWALERRRARRLSRRNRKSGFSKWPYTLWYVVGSLANQGGEEENLPTASSTRILIMFWWFYLIVVSGYHSGILTAILSFPRQPDFIQSLEDFMALEAAESGAVRLWTEQGGELAELLSSTDNLRKSALLELAQESGGQAARYPIHKIDFKRQRQRLLDVVASGRGAYMEDKGTLNLIITQDYLEQRKCLFKASRFPIDVQPMSLVLSRKLGASCIRLINRLSVRILRTGLSLKWRRQHEPKGNECLHSVIMNAGNVAKIEMRHVMFAFWMLAGGLALGAVLLLLELLWLFTADSIESDSSSSSDDSISDHHLNDTSSDDELASSNSESSSSFVARGQAATKQSVKRDKKRSKSQAEEQAASKAAAKKAASEAKRKKRVQRVMDMFSTLLEGRVYSGFLTKISDNVHSQARRASQALLHIPRSLVVANQQHPSSPAAPTTGAPISTREPQTADEPIRRRQVSGRLHSLNKVAPLDRL